MMNEKTPPAKRKPAPKRPKKISQHQDYNNIFQENLDELFKWFMARIFGLENRPNQPLPGDKKLYRTQVREPDILRVLLDEKGVRSGILHGEVHLKDEKAVNERYFEYGGLLIRKFHLLIDQHLLFIGKGRPKHIQEIVDMGSLKSHIKIWCMEDLPASEFIAANEPEAVMMAILANFEGKPPDEVILAILQRIRQLTGDSFQLQKYQKQLEILSNLRNLQPETVKIIDTMPVQYDIRTDVRFKQGKTEGKAEGIEIGIAEANAENLKRFVTTLLTEGGFSEETIARLTNTTIEFVRKMKLELDRGNQPKKNGK